jgi:hypothetical protein
MIVDLGEQLDVSAADPGAMDVDDYLSRSRNRDVGFGHPR